MSSSDSKMVHNHEDTREVLVAIL